MTPQGGQPLAEISVGDILGEGQRGGRADSRGVRSLVLAYVRQNPDGVTVQMVASDAHIGGTWAQKVLDDLVHQRELYSRIVPGVKATLYYPNGKLIHKFLQESREIGDQIFRVSVHEGRRSPRVQVQERRFTLLDGERVEGSIFVDVESVPALLELMKDVVTRLNNQELVSRLSAGDSKDEKDRR